MKKLLSKLDFVEGGKLLKSILEKEKEELNKNVKETEGEETETPISEHRLRNLAWDGDFGFDWALASTNILGQKMQVIYSINLGKGKVDNSLTLDINGNSIPLGNTAGTSSNTKDKKAKTNEKQIGKIPLASVAVTLSVRIGCDLDYSVSLVGTVFSIKLEGSVYATAGVVFGWDNIASIEVGVKGTVINVNFSTDIQRSPRGVYSKKSVSLTATFGIVHVYATGKLLTLTLFDEQYKIFGGWPAINKTW